MPAEVRAIMVVAAMTFAPFPSFAQFALSEDLMMTFVALGLCVVIPLVAILTSHQRKMAEMFHRRDRETGADAARLARLEQEVSLLRQQVHELVIRQDDQLRLPPSAPSAESPVQRRLEN